MALIDSQQLHDMYLRLLHDWCKVSAEDNGLRVRFPFADIHRTMIEAYVAETGAGLLVTDYGLLLCDLQANGIAMGEDTHKFERFCGLAASNGFRIEDQQLRADVTLDNLVVTLHSFAHVWMFAQGLSLAARKGLPVVNVGEIFRRLESYSLKPSLNAAIAGKSGLRHRFPISWERDTHQVVARAMSGHQPATDMQSFAWSVDDLRQTHSTDYRAVVFLPEDKTPATTSRLAKVADAASIRLIATDRIQESVGV